MSQSGYTPWSVTAGEIPTTAYWNILGYNDASFNTGNGFNDQAIVSRHMNLGWTVDANGWTVIDFGTFKEYLLTGSTGYSIGGNGWQFVTAVTTLPVGISTIAYNMFIRANAGSRDSAVTASFNQQIGNGGFSLAISNNYSGTVTNYIDWTISILVHN